MNQTQQAAGKRVFWLCGLIVSQLSPFRMGLLVLGDTAFGLFIARHEKGPPKERTGALDETDQGGVMLSARTASLLPDRPDILIRLSLLRFFSL